MSDTISPAFFIYVIGGFVIILLAILPEPNVGPRIPAPKPPRSYKNMNPSPATPEPSTRSLTETWYAAHGLPYVPPPNRTLYLGKEWRFFFCHTCRAELVFPAKVSVKEAFQQTGWSEKRRGFVFCRKCKEKE